MGELIWVINRMNIYTCNVCVYLIRLRIVHVGVVGPMSIIDMCREHIVIGYTHERKKIYAKFVLATWSNLAQIGLIHKFWY